MNAEKPIAGFKIFSRAWYAEAAMTANLEYTEEIMIGHYYESGGCDGEFGLRWYELDGSSAQLEAFYDSWKVLAQHPELITALAAFDGERITPDQAIEMLKGLGFADLTAYERK